MSIPRTAPVLRISRAACLPGAGMLLQLAPADEPKPDRTLISRENAREGARDWQLTRVRVDGIDGFRSPWIEGFASKQSVRAGESIDFLVSTNPPGRFLIEFFRMGYYGGRGARRMLALGPFEGKIQATPRPGEKDIHECRWEPTTTLIIPGDWPSGVYLGRLTFQPPDENSATPGRATWCSWSATTGPSTSWFSARTTPGRLTTAGPATTRCTRTPRGTKVPGPTSASIARTAGKPRFRGSVDVTLLTVGSGEFKLPFEFPLAYFLEQYGYDVAYCSNADMVTPDRALKSKAWISVGHDEYWDRRQFESVVRLRDAGVNLLFLSGNAVCWVAPLLPSGDGRPARIFSRGGPYGARYKYARQREREHGPFPERGPDEGYLMGARNVEPVNGGGDWICSKPEHWIFEGTGMARGEHIPGLIGWEYHGDPPTDLPGLEVVGEGTALVGGVTPQRWSATIYPGPKGNFVFNASTIFWAQGLSSPPGHTLPWTHWTRPHGPDDRVQRITHNLLRRAIKGPG